MPANLHTPDRWDADIRASVNMYNEWFMRFAPEAFAETRELATKSVKRTFEQTENLRNVNAATLREHPEILPTLRMCTCPPIAVDRLIGLAGAKASLVKRMEALSEIDDLAEFKKEKQRLVRTLGVESNLVEMERVGEIVERMADDDFLVWLKREDDPEPTPEELERAATIVADRLCGSMANPIVRNAQETRQLQALQGWLESAGYRQVPLGSGLRFDAMEPGTFSFRLNVPVELDTPDPVNIPVDAVIKPLGASPESFPMLIEAKSAGDFANVNKRRKEEATKMRQLRRAYGEDVHFNLFLCGYFNRAYLRYEAAEGIDWVWEHRIDDLAQFLCPEKSSAASNYNAS